MLFVRTAGAKRSSSRSARDGPGPGHEWFARTGQANQVIAALMLIIAACFIPWIVLLGFYLPPHYEAGHWPLLWIGYDTAELSVLAFVAWASWYRREILAPACLVAAVLFLCDAWFDIVTSWGHRDQWITLATGLGAEIPLAIAFLWLYRRLVLKALAAFHDSLRDGMVISNLVSAPLILSEGEGRTDEVKGTKGVGLHASETDRSAPTSPLLETEVDEGSGSSDP